MAVFQNWERRLLAAIGAPATRENILFLDEWQRREGGTARDNPLNTTQPAAGASNYNSVGVKNYTSPAQGVAATAATIQNGRYPTLLAALRKGNIFTDISLNRSRLASEISTWGTKSLADEIRKGTNGGVNTTNAGRIPGAGAVSGAVDAVESVGSFLGKITSVAFLLRAGEVIGGAALVGIGVTLLARQIGLAAPAMPGADAVERQNQQAGARERAENRRAESDARRVAASPKLAGEQDYERSRQTDEIPF